MVYKRSIKLCDFVCATIFELDSNTYTESDTGLSELLVPLTRTEQFNKSLEIQQSKFQSPAYRSFILQSIDLLASYEVSAQITAIEEMIAEGADMQMVVRLLCLASITAGGIKSKSLENLKREILQVDLVLCGCQQMNK